MKNTKILVNTKNKSYPIYFGNKILNKIGILIKKNLPRVIKISIIVDKNVPKFLLKKIIGSLKKYKIKIYKISSPEKSKSFKSANYLIENLLKYNLNRSDCIIAFGGGAVGDLSAFVASITKRGTKFINIPTTLLAQVDASIGGKTAVNSKQGKNLIGTFYQPDFVLTDISTLNSLSKREMVCGYAEILKHSLILDRNFFFWLSNNAKKIINNKNEKLLLAAIIKSCKIKSKIVSKDEREENLRMILNFGHTFAHGFEATKKFSKKLNHGEAVLLGMILASKISYQKKLLGKKDFDLIKKHYLNLKLPVKISNFFKREEISKIISFMKKDKKNLNEKINLILLKKIGKASKPNAFGIKDFELKKILLKNYL